MNLVSSEDDLWMTWLLIPTLILIVAYGLKQTSKKNYPPGPCGIPVFGYLPFLNPQAPYRTLANLAKKYGKIYSVTLGSVPAVVLADSKLIRLALAKDEFAGRPPLRITHGIMRGFGIIGAEGAWWREQRRFLVNSLHSMGTGRNSSLEQKIHLQQVIRTHVETLLHEISQSSASPIDPHRLLGHLFANIVIHLMFGKSFDASDTKFARQIELVDSGFKQVNVMGTLNFLPFLRYVPYFRNAFEKLLEGKNEHHQFLRACTSSLRNVVNEDSKSNCFASAFLSRMQSGENNTFVEEQLMHSLADIFGAGLETTRVTAEWFLLFMATFRDIQIRIQEELDAVSEINLETHLPYMEAAVLETQRLGNIVPLGAPHGTTQDIQFEGYHICKGTMVIPLLWYVHMDPLNWSNPETFDPTRFLENGEVRKAQCFMPFSAGRRMCPGDDLARMELLITLTSLLRDYTILPPSDEPLDLQPQMGFTLTPNHFKLRFLPRSNQR